MADFHLVQRDFAFRPRGPGSDSARLFRLLLRTDLLSADEKGPALFTSCFNRREMHHHFYSVIKRRGPMPALARVLSGKT